MNNSLKTVLSVAVMGALLAGCQSTGGYSSAPQNDPYYENETEEQRMSRTKRNALVGAGIGVVAGLLSGGDATERRQRALVGAGVGALAGGAIGRYQDNQERALRERMAGDNITLDMPAAITFGFDSYALRPESFGVLDRVAETLREYDQTIIEVAGHTDSVGTQSYNQRLSEQRAQSVANHLGSRGINSQRMMVTGAGPNYPIASNATDEGRAKNRRVEITLVPLRES
jgi:outer membrane protein OmpA-like peptidoglycan-associated protein